MGIRDQGFGIRDSVVHGTAETDRPPVGATCMAASELKQHVLRRIPNP
jgi:hypothetical protein